MKMSPIIIGLCLALAGCSTEPVFVLTSTGETTTMGCVTYEWEYIDGYDENGQCIKKPVKYKLCDIDDCFYSKAYTRSGDCITFGENSNFDRPKTICGTASITTLY